MWECKDEEESFRNIIRQLQERKDRKVLLIIDSITDSDKDMEEIMGSIPAVVIAASREPYVPGFETYEIETLSATSGSLVFRDNYGTALTEKDQRCLEEILDNRDWRCASILRYLGELASQKQWSVEELKDYLEKNGLNPDRTEEA